MGNEYAILPPPPPPQKKKKKNAQGLDQVKGSASRFGMVVGSNKLVSRKKGGRKCKEKQSML